MTDERWPRVKALFQAAVDRPPEERGAFLAAETGGDEVLRSEVASLLAADDAGAGFLDCLPATGESVLADALAELPALDPTSSHPALASGRRLGPYEVIAPLGAGAMGEVYRARDTRLNREVALKVLPEPLAHDPDRLVRFTREAQLLATLNHPNVGAIYGIEDSNGAPALVLELVDGPTLADRLALGPIPLHETLTIVRQVADAVEAAHEKGIIHRDLKPANIKISATGVVKVLDFGLAKVWTEATPSALSLSPKLTATGIGARMILGTPAYMSPEQVRGAPLDRRTDLWSFGCVLHEMLVGRAPFAGETISDTFAAILEREPDRAMLPADTPAPIRRLLRRCLEKDRRARLASVSDARLEIEDAIAAPADETRAGADAVSRRGTPAAVAALVGGAMFAMVFGWVMMRSPAEAPAVPSRFVIVPSTAQPLNSFGGDRDIALSPDGHYFVYLGGGGLGAGAPLMVRATDQLEATALPVFGLGVFFSPDSRWIGFFTSGEIKKASITGGPAITLGSLTGASLGASWGDDHTIVFATDDPTTGLWRLSADGGVPTVLTRPDASQGESDHAFPSVLPDGRGVLFTIIGGGQADNGQVAVLDAQIGRRKILIRGGSQAQYVSAPQGTAEDGYLIYASAGTLRAVRFDLARLEVLGAPVTVVENVMIKPTGAANYSISRQGTLFYASGGVKVQMTPRSLVWVDRRGHEEPVSAPLRAYGAPRISPDGTRLAVNVSSDQGTDIWIWDLARETLRRLTFGPGINGLPLWTPDGRRIIFTSNRTGVFNLYAQAVDGTGGVDRLTTSMNPQYHTSISSDGRLIIFETEPIPVAPGTAGRTRLFQLAGSVRRTIPEPAGAVLSLADPVGQTLFDGVWPEFSPDGRYIAYQSVGSRSEVYVRPFPRVEGGRWQISTAGGTRPAWSRTGHELFYLDPANTLTAVPVQTSDSTFTAGTPGKVFDGKYATPFPPRHYDVSPDGQRFLMAKDIAADSIGLPVSMVVVLNWFEELKARMSASKP